MPRSQVQVPVEYLERNKDKGGADRPGNQIRRPVEDATFVVPKRLNEYIFRVDGVSDKALPAVYRARFVVHSIQKAILSV